MKRYLAFAYRIYYPEGGWNDYHGAFDTIDEAKQTCLDYINSPEGINFVPGRHEWHVIDMQSGKRVCNGHVEAEI